MNLLRATMLTWLSLILDQFRRESVCDPEDISAALNTPIMVCGNFVNLFIFYF